MLNQAKLMSNMEFKKKKKCFIRFRKKKKFLKKAHIIKKKTNTISHSEFLK